MPLYIDTRGQTKIAIAICARCSLKFPYSELMPDPNYPGLYVCKDDRDDFDPYRLPARETENITLDHARPDVAIDSFAPIQAAPGQPLTTEDGQPITTEDGQILMTDASPFGVPPAIYGPVAPWQPNAAYQYLMSVTPQDINDEAVQLPQYWFICVSGGTSGATAPDWTTSAGTSVIDGEITWYNNGIYPN